MKQLRFNRLAMASVIALASSSAYSADGIDPVVVTAARLTESMRDVIGSVFQAQAHTSLNSLKPLF